MRTLPDELRSNWIKSYEFLFVSFPSATYIHDFDKLKSQIGMTDELIVMAIERALKAKRKHTLAWVRTVLTDLVPHGITTPEEWIAFEAEQLAEDEKQRKPAKPTQSRKPTRSSTVFLDREKKDKEYYDHIYKRFDKDGDSK